MRAAAVSAIAYVALTAMAGLLVLGSLTSAIAHDAGDPLLTAAILTWNAEHVPYTAAWWQFPIFHPAADALAFSEHLLGVSALATPLYWLSGSTLAAYNTTLLLTYPLCALAMYALILRLTRSAPAAFLGGLAYAFAPVRVSQLPHIHLLVMFYLPLALLGLHAYLETHRRRWLVLFGVSWMLQGAASGYLLIYGSVLIGAWVAWFVVASRRWRELAAIAITLVIAALPLAPLLYRYKVVHARYGFVREFGEAGAYGADIASLLCAPPLLTFWGWLRVGCKPEGELFPGAALAVLCVVGGAVAWRQARSSATASHAGPPATDPRARGVGAGGRGVVAKLRAALLVAGAAFGLIALSALVVGDWRIAAGPLRASVSGPMKPFSSAAYLLFAAMLLSPRLASAARRMSFRVFYLVAAVGAWVLSWGPEPNLLGTQVLYQAPFAWLMRLPGGDAVRVPGRFWLISMTCAIVLMGMLVAGMLKGRGRRTTAAVVAIAACGLVIDGWAQIPARPAPAAPPRADLLRGRVVVELPLGQNIGDIAAAYRAVTGGWRTVNGFSGYEPAWYDGLRKASRSASPEALRPFANLEDGHVLVSENADDLRRMLDAEPSAELVGRGAGTMQYRLRRTR